MMSEVAAVMIATMGLRKRLYFYAKPRVTQRTSLRLNGVPKEEIRREEDIARKMPPNSNETSDEIRFYTDHWTAVKSLLVTSLLSGTSLGAELCAETNFFFFVSL